MSLVEQGEKTTLNLLLKFDNEHVTKSILIYKNGVFDNCVLLKMHIFTFLLAFINQQIVHKVICCGETFAHYLTLSSKPTSWIIVSCALRISLSYDTSISLGSRFAKILSGFFLV